MNASNLECCCVSHSHGIHTSNAIKTYSLALAARQKCNLGMVREILGSHKRRDATCSSKYSFYPLSIRKCTAVLALHEGEAIIPEKSEVQQIE